MAINQGTVNNVAGAVDDIFFKPEAFLKKAQGLNLEAENYDAAIGLAQQNEQFTEQSTAIKQAQAERNIFQTIGGAEADIGHAGLAESGSALDILRDSASQGALTHQLVGQQGLITEEGFNQQAIAAKNMREASRIAAGAAEQAGANAKIGGYMKIAAAIGSVFLK